MKIFDWKQREALVQEMIPVIGRLFSQRNVGIYIYGRPLHNRSVTFIMKSHRFVRQVERNEMSEFETLCESLMLKVKKASVNWHGPAL